MVTTVSTTTSASLGGIEEIESSLRWDATRLAGEIEVRRAALVDHGFTWGSRIVILHGGSAHFFADLLAVWSLGATAVCLDPTLTSNELKTVLAFAKPAGVLTRGTAHALVGGSFDVDVLDLTGLHASSASPPAWRLPDSTEPALVLFTSGTTGTPKGVVLSFRAVANRITTNAEIIGPRRLARSLLTLSTHFGHGLIGNGLTPLLAGCDLVVPPLGAARNLGQIIDDHRITFLSSVPAFWRMALRLSRPPAGRSLTRVHVGSSPLPARLWSDIVTWSRAEVVNCYGMTETANWFAGCSSDERIAEGLVGLPWGGHAGIARPDGTIAERGEGEIVVSSPSLMSEYLDRQDLTAAALRNGWYFTGDRGRIDPDGRIWVTGRIRDEINRAGFKVQPEEIDRLLESHPEIAEACVFGVPDPVSGEVVAAALTTKSGAEIDVDDLRMWCQTRIRREAIPDHWFFLHSIPRTSRGKLNRSAVRQQLYAAGDRYASEAAGLNR